MCVRDGTDPISVSGSDPEIILMIIIIMWIGASLVCVGVKTDPFHVEGERLPASGFRLGPAQHHVGVAHLAGVDVCGRKRSFDLTCRAKRGGGTGG